MKAVIWRALMAIGMKLHHVASPKPPSPAFTITIPSRLSEKRGKFKLVFYVPESYYDTPDDTRFPVVINYHGGGFTLGTGTDDARWARSVTTEAEAIMVSVEYRLAPKYPFSVGVEDATDALLYVASHADELRIDPHRIALSGFSAGANFAFTVPIVFYDLAHDVGKRRLRSDDPSSSTPGILSAKVLSSPNASSSSINLKTLEPSALEVSQELPDFTIRCIISFYPPTDFRITREEKRATNPKKEKNLPPMLTNLFDESYMGPDADKIDVHDPYLSPAAASDTVLREALPDNIVIYTCEWDMLNAEGVAFGERLQDENIGKIVKGGLIKEVVHAFDKKPNPLSFPKSAQRCYGEACAELTRLFGRSVAVESRMQLSKSKTVERFDDDDDELSDLENGTIQDPRDAEHGLLSKGKGRSTPDLESRM
jgi:acetyl esterase/lipase